MVRKMASIARPAAHGATRRLRGRLDGRGRARIAEDAGADIIGINFGCPAKRVTNGYAGSRR